MKDWPLGVTGTRNEDCLRALAEVVEARDVRDHERHLFDAGFIEGWQARAVDMHGRGLVTITRERLADLERRAAELRRRGETGHSAATGHDRARPDLYPPDPVQGPAVPDDPG